MLKGVYKRKPVTEESKKKMSESRLKRKQELGYINSPEARKKMSIAKTGEKNPNYGIHRSDETKRKIGDGNRGKFVSEETGKKISIALKGKATWNKGLTKETDERVKNFSGKNHPMFGRFGEEHPCYKGNDINIRHMHVRVKKIKTIPFVCDICHQKTDKRGITKLVLSNIKNHKYTDNPDDYQYVHESCHKKYDANKRKEVK